METTFNKLVFEQRVGYFAAEFMNHVNTAAEEKAILTGNPIMTDDETRLMAKQFFIQQMAQYLADKLK